MSFVNKIARLAASPQGRRLLNQAKEMANDPKRRQQAKDAVEKVRGRAEEYTRRNRGSGH
ncbi:hypothetical protein [Sciscionella marina]|uniref:hypothetical protein n=1 Tax=Sciscionella marina TaxID=508770 RepID=UPI00035F1B3D|nr:hypothetical protein [Sciscionella marina]